MSECAESGSKVGKLMDDLSTAVNAAKERRDTIQIVPRKDQIVVIVQIGDKNPEMEDGQVDICWYGEKLHKNAKAKLKIWTEMGGRTDVDADPKRRGHS